MYICVDVYSCRHPSLFLMFLCPWCRAEFQQILADLEKRIEDEETPPGIPEGDLKEQLMPANTLKENVNEEEFEEMEAERGEVKEDGEEEEEEEEEPEADPDDVEPVGGWGGGG